MQNRSVTSLILKRIAVSGLVSFCGSLALAKAFPAYDASGRIGFVKVDPKAGTGECLPEPNDPVEVLKRSNVTGAPSATPEELALAKVFNALDKMGDGRFQYHKNAKFKFENTTGASAYEEDGIIHIRGADQNKAAFSANSSSYCHGGHCHEGTGQNNVAHLTHELGHYIGNQPNKGDTPFKGGTVYEAYASAMIGNICPISSYAVDDGARAKRGNHEEFSEVFAAYLTNPELLANTPGCERSIKFFSAMFGETSMPKDCDNRMLALDGSPFSTVGDTFMADSNGGGTSGHSEGNPAAMVGGLMNSLMNMASGKKKSGSKIQPKKGEVFVPVQPTARQPASTASPAGAGIK